jgi:uncharacterized membrane protein YeaQ/YmgE (transglycosylase-associated protein family)
MAILPLLIQLLTGAVGGNIVGKLAKNIDLGVLWNSVAGIIGGGLGGQLLGLLGMEAGPSGSFDLASVLGSVASGGAGGGVLMAVIGVIKSMMAKGK